MASPERRGSGPSHTQVLYKELPCASGDYRTSASRLVFQDGFRNEKDGSTVQQFRRLYMETPTGAKSKGIQQLKARCLAAGIVRHPLKQEEAAGPSAPLKRRHTSHEDLEAVDVSPKPFDWERLAKMLEARGLRKAENEQSEVCAKPEPTPARAALPEFVLEGLKKQAPEVKPFIVNPVEEEDAIAPEESAEQSKKQRKKGDSKKKAAKAKAKPKGKKGKKVVAGPEEEKNLAPGGEKLEEPSAPEVTDVNPRLDKLVESLCGGGSVYVPGEFAKRRKAFIDEQRNNGKDYATANKVWMESQERATLRGLYKSEGHIILVKGKTGLLLGSSDGRGIHPGRW